MTIPPVLPLVRSLNTYQWNRLGTMACLDVYTRTARLEQMGHTFVTFVGDDGTVYGYTVCWERHIVSGHYSIGICTNHNIYKPFQ